MAERLKASDLVFQPSTDFLAEGGTAVVFKAHWLGARVAVKALKVGLLPHATPKNVSKKLTEDFRKEALLWGNLRHPNVIHLFGIVIPESFERRISESDGQQDSNSAWAVNGENLGRSYTQLKFESLPLMVMEYAQCGNLANYMHSYHQKLDVLERVRIASEIASGMRYLHSQDPPIYHGDLKPANVLIMADLTVKLTDFGFSRVKTFSVQLQPGASTLVAGTLRYMAPERMEGYPVTERTDVYSYAMTLYELLTGKTPFELDGLDSDPLVVAAVLIKRQRPRIVHGLPHAADSILRLVEVCWRDHPSHRPAFGQIVKVLGHKCVRDTNLTGDQALECVSELLGERKMVELKAPLPPSLKPPDHPTLEQPKADDSYDFAAPLALEVGLGAIELAVISHTQTSEKSSPTREEIIRRESEKSERKDFKHAAVSAVSALTLSEDGATLFTADRSGYTHMWDLASVRPLRTFSNGTDRIGAMALTRGSQYLLAAAGKVIYIWSVSTGKIVQIFQSHSTPINAMALTEDGNFLLSGSGQSASEVDGDYDIRRWFVNDSLTNGSSSNATLFFNNWGGITGFAVHKNGNHFFSSSFDRTIIMWDVTTKTAVRTFHGHTTGVLCIALSSDGKTLYSGSMDNTAMSWDVETGKRLMTYFHPNWVTSIAAHPKISTRFATGSIDSYVRVWDADSTVGTVFAGHYPHPVSAVTFHPEGESLVSASTDGKVYLWDL
ncbi:kinase-like domain-containing protein [Cladochytrium replicatum]|nr:kinase-like domain-containing protein [Cladochytrium replicatum]